MNERASAHELLKRYGEDLQQTIELLQHKISIVASTTSGLLGQIEESLLSIVNATNSTLQSFQSLSLDLTQNSSIKLPSSIHERLRTVDNCLNQVVAAETNTTKILSILQGSLMLTNQRKLHSASVNINDIINISLQQVMKEEKEGSHPFKFVVKKHTEISTLMIYALQEDLVHAFTHFFRQSMNSMKKKQYLLGASYEAILGITIEKINKNIKIMIHDNGQGLSNEQIRDLFQQQEMSCEVRDLGLMFAKDLITYAHHGSVEIDSRLGQYLQISIQIPT